MAAEDHVEDGSFLDRARAALDLGASTELWRTDDTALLQQLATAQRVVNQAQGTYLTLVAEARSRGISERDHGWSTAHALVEAQPQLLRTARATVALATDLRDHADVATALRAGEVSLDQTKIIVHTLQQQPESATVEQTGRIEAALLEHAKTFDPLALRRIGNRLIDVICSDAVDRQLGQALDREAAQARRDRYLNWTDTGHGSIDLRGRLPLVEGEALIQVITAHADAARPALDALDADGEAVQVSPAQRRADALMALVSRHQQQQLAPDHGGDRPRVTITLSYTDLVSGLQGATLAGMCTAVSPGEARRLACDADIIPAVLGTKSATLDLGRKHRLFTGDLRHALVLRDGGCVFPACDRRPSDCEGHHLIPWWSGGPTSLRNAALLCPHHHRSVEPDPNAPPGSRWEIRLDSRGRPELLPPIRLDPSRTPRQHRRFDERDLLTG